MERDILLSVSELQRTFGGVHPLEVLRGVSFELARGESLVITGPSGSGKSTLLHCLGTLLPPSSGSIRIAGTDPFSLAEPDLARFRNRVIGFIFQDHHLLPQYSVLENVLLPALVFSEGRDEVQERALHLLARVGLTDRLEHRPAELSGGERQRVAVARAVLNRPSLLLCDEPTGNLDRSTAETVSSLLFELHQEEKNVLIAVTHSRSLADRFPRHFELVEGTCVAA